MAGIIIFERIWRRRGSVVTWSWDMLQIERVDINYYGRGRVDINHCGRGRGLEVVNPLYGAP